jgi:hypothetical protein
VTNVDRNETRGFYRLSKLTNFGHLGIFCHFLIWNKYILKQHVSNNLESEKNNHFLPSERFFDQMRFLEKTTLYTEE